MSICFCCTMLCFWNGKKKRIQKRKKEKTKTWNVEKIKMENEMEMEMEIEIESINTNIDTNILIDTHTVGNIDPFKWNNNQVINWLKQTKLLIKYCPHINGKELLTKYQTFAIETNDNNKLIKEIKKLRLESDSYYNYMKQENNKPKRKIRKPPRKLRRKASRKKSKTTNECEVSLSSTVEIMPHETYSTIDEKNINKIHTYDSSEGTEGTDSMNDDDYYENTSDRHQVYQ
eukprot:432595_1